MPDVLRKSEQKRAERTNDDWGLETSVPGERTDTQLAPVLADMIGCRDAIDVYEGKWRSFARQGIPKFLPPVVSNPVACGESPCFGLHQQLGN